MIPVGLRVDAVPLKERPLNAPRQTLPLGMDTSAFHFREVFDFLMLPNGPSSHGFGCVLRSSEDFSEAAMSSALCQCVMLGV